MKLDANFFSFWYRINFTLTYGRRGQVFKRKVFWTKTIFVFKNKSPLKAWINRGSDNSRHANPSVFQICNSSQIKKKKLDFAFSNKSFAFLKRFSFFFALLSNFFSNLHFWCPFFSEKCKFLKSAYFYRLHFRKKCISEFSVFASSKNLYFWKMQICHFCQSKSFLKTLCK